MRIRKWISVCLLLLLCLGLFENLVPQVQEVMVADNFVTEITGLPFTDPIMVDVDSKGNIYVTTTYTNDVWRSKDQGSTWTLIFNGVACPKWYLHSIFVDSKDNIYANIYRAGYYDWVFYRSTDGGNTWTPLLEGIEILWHMIEATNGYLYVNAYSAHRRYLYRSIDGGNSFSLWRNVTGDDHFHGVAEDIANGDIYVFTGDGANSLIERWDGVSWSTIAPAPAVDMWSDGTYVYVCSHQHVYRMPSGGTWEQREPVWDGEYVGAKLGGSYEVVRFHNEGLVILGTQIGQVHGSWDGQRWVKLIDVGGSGHAFFSISNRRPIYTVDYAGRLFRISITKEDLINLFYRQYVSKMGSKINEANYTLEQRIWNGTNYLDLTEVALSNVQASIKGLSYCNHFKNSGFETGTLAEWAQFRAPLGTISTDSPVHGAYCYVREHNASIALPLYKDWVPSSVGDIHIISFFVRANASKASAIQLAVLWEGYPLPPLAFFNVSTSWQRYDFGIVHNSSKISATRFRWFIYFMETVAPLKTYIDSFMYVKPETGINIEGKGTDGIYYLDRFKTAAYFEGHGMQNTTNPQLIIDSQTFSHSGTLTNGTESPATSLSGILSAAVKVEANIAGSGQALLKITGTRILYEDSIILKERKDDVYYGRYYGTFFPTTATTDLIVVTNLQANITLLSYSANKLTLNIHSPSRTTSTAKVYCGPRGEPTATCTVNGTMTWSYNCSTTILTLNISHEGPAKVLIYWKFPGDVNNDGVADVFDFALIGKAYGSTPGCSNWNEGCDINGDQVIDIDDLEICDDNYGVRAH